MVKLKFIPYKVILECFKDLKELVIRCNQTGNQVSSQVEVFSMKFLFDYTMFKAK